MEYGKIVYYAFWENMHLDAVPFETLKPEVQQAWNAAAKAVVSEFVQKSYNNYK